MIDHDPSCAKVVNALRIACDVACDCGYDEAPKQHAETYGLIVSFPDQSETFVLGFEAGMIWQQMQDGNVSLDVNVHTKNIEVLTRMCAASGVSPKFCPTNCEGWTNMRMTGKTKPNLRLVGKEL